MLNPQSQVWPRSVAKTRYKAALGLWVFLPVVPYHPPLMLALALQFWVALVSQGTGVFGGATGPGVGVFGNCKDVPPGVGIGVFGQGDSGTGVQGTGGKAGVGVWGATEQRTELSCSLR
jgi:hypothetical protein